MPRKLRQLRAELRKAGYALDHTTGDHTILKHPLIPGHVNIAGNDGDDAQHYQEKAVREAVRKLREAEQAQKRHLQKGQREQP
jgi:predicted RNA binding protein YcfA (HicA-like mRNA interferase family)